MKPPSTSVRQALGWLWSRVADVHATKSYAQEGEDIVLRRLLDAKERGFYIDVGAHHPRRFSNTYLFYRQGWRGINVEPNPEAIRQFRRERPRDINLQVGISATPGMSTYFEFEEPALNTFDQAMVDHRLRNAHSRLVRSTEVPLVRLEEVLRTHLPQGQAVDFLSVDVEGSDLSVLKSNDWSRFRPACVLAEVLQAESLEQVLQGDVTRYMGDQRYTLVSKTLNTLFFLDQQRG